MATPFTRGTSVEYTLPASAGISTIPSEDEFTMMTTFPFKFSPARLSNLSYKKKKNSASSQLNSDPSKQIRCRLRVQRRAVTVIVVSSSKTLFCLKFKRSNQGTSISESQNY